MAEMMMAPTPSTSAAGASSVQSSYAQSRGQVPPTTSLLGPLAPFPRAPEPEVIAHRGVQPPGSNGHEYSQPRRPDSPPRARANAQGSHIQAPVGIDGKQSRLVFTTGLFVERKPPYAVLATGVLQDANGTCQGQLGYSNHVVMPGDRLVRIESRPVNVMERMQWWAGSDKEMLEVLNGPQGSNVALVLARSRDDTEYQVVLKRHVPAADQETNTSAPMRAVHLPNSQNLYDGPPVSKTRLTVMGGVGVAVRRGDEQDDYGPVLVQRVHEFGPMHGKIRAGDRLLSINTENIDHLPMKTIHALIDGQDSTRVSLQFEHVETTRRIPNMVAFWTSIAQRQPGDIVIKVPFDLTRSHDFPLSKATDEDDWSYNRADPAVRQVETHEMPSAFPREGGPLDILSGFPGLGNVMGPAAREEPVVGVLQVGVKAAKNLPMGGSMGTAGVFVHVMCAEKSFSTDVVYQDKSTRASAVNPQFDSTFEIPVRKNQQESNLILQVVHKEAFIADIPFGSLMLPKAAAFVSKKRAQEGWYGLADDQGHSIAKGFNGQRPLLHLNVSWLPVNQEASNQEEGSEFAKTLAPALPTAPPSKAPLSKVLPSKPPPMYTSGHGAVPVDHVPSSHVMRARYCLHRMAEYAKSPLEGTSSGYNFENLDKDFLEDERFEAVQAFMAILKLKEQLQASTKREHELSTDLQNSLNQIRVIVDQRQRDISDQAILEGLQEEMSQLQVRLHSKEEEVRSLQEQLEGMDNEMATMREIIDRQDRELEKSILEMQTARGAHRNIDAAQAKLKGAEEEIAVLSRCLAEAEDGKEKLAAKVTLQSAEPWARKFEGKWRSFRAMHSEHIMNLSGMLEAPSGPKDLLINLMQELGHFLPKASEMLQAADQFDKEAEDGFVAELLMVQRLKGYIKTIEDNSKHRHTAFVNFRRKIEATSRGDAGWKQILEQEILHLQEHVESVNRDLVSCSLALRESLAVHDDAHNLVLLLTRSRDRRRETRYNIILFFKQLQEKLKSSSGQFSHELDSLLNFVMEHYSDQMETLEVCDRDFQTLLDQVMPKRLPQGDQGRASLSMLVRKPASDATQK